MGRCKLVINFAFGLNRLLLDLSNSDEKDLNEWIDLWRFNENEKRINRLTWLLVRKILEIVSPGYEFKEGQDDQALCELIKKIPGEFLYLFLQFFIDCDYCSIVWNDWSNRLESFSFAELDSFFAKDDVISNLKDLDVCLDKIGLLMIKLAENEKDWKDVIKISKMVLKYRSTFPWEDWVINRISKELENTTEIKGFSVEMMEIISDTMRFSNKRMEFRRLLGLSINEGENNDIRLVMNDLALKGQLNRN